jgi:hypothetical protein
MKTWIMTVIAMLGLCVMRPAFAAAAGDEGLTDAGSSAAAKRLIVATAKLAYRASEVHDAAMASDNYELALRAGIVSQVAAKATVAFVLIASQGQALTPEQKEQIRAKFSEIREKYQSLRQRWEQLTPQQQARLRERIEAVMERVDALRTGIDQLESGEVPAVN